MSKLYCIPKLNQLKSFLEFSEKYNACFEYNDFFTPSLLDDENSIKKIIQQYQATGRDMSKDTIHGAFLDICVNSTDPSIFAASNHRVHQCMDIARKMGVSAVIFHTNYIVNFKLKSYLNGWVNLNEEYWRTITTEYPEIKIYMENMFDDSPVLLTKLAKRMEDVSNFGVCLDIAHAAISGSPVQPWLDNLKPYVKHLHINDNDGIEDLHQPVGSGAFDWIQFDTWAKNLKKAPSVLIEVRSFEDLEKSIQFMSKNNIFPFE